jgi:vacuolar-type H+-ATPase subunit I/STV1
LKEFLKEIEAKVKEAGEAAEDAEGDYKTAMGMKPDIEGLMEQINKHVANATEIFGKAETTYDEAKQYKNTNIQTEAFKITEFLYNKIKGIEASLTKKEAEKQKIFDDIIDDFGFAMNDVEDADNHYAQTMNYAKEVEEMLEAYEDEADEAAEEAADKCDEAEKKLEGIKNEAE